MKVKNTINSLIIFSLVPLSQIILFFSLKSSIRTTDELHSLQETMNMSELQMFIFQLFIITIYSLISFMLMYLVYGLLLQFSKKNDSKALYISLILSIGISNGILIIINTLNINTNPWINAFLNIIILAIMYFYLSKDKTGLLLLTIAAVFINVVVPLFVNIKTAVSF